MGDEAAAVSSSKDITVTINGTEYERHVEARKLLIHFIRDDVDLTGSYAAVWILTAASGVIAALLHFPIKDTAPTLAALALAPPPPCIISFVMSPWTRTLPAMKACIPAC